MKKRFLMFVAGVLLVLFVVSLFGIGDVAGVLANANPYYIAAALGLQASILLLLGLRQYVIGGRRVSYLKSLRVAMSGNFINLVVPGPAVGGEPLKMYMLRKEYGNAKATAVIAVDDFVELLGTILVVIFAVLFLAPTVAPNLIIVFAAFLVCVMLVFAGALKLLLTPKWLKPMVSWFIDKISKHQNIERKDYAKMFYNAFTILLGKKKMLGAAMGITILGKLAEFLIIWLAFASLGLFLPWREVVVAWTIIVVFVFVPWLPGSLGLVEFGAASLLVTLGLSTATAAGGILVGRAVSFWFVLFAGAACIYMSKTMGELPKNVNLKTVSEEKFSVKGGKTRKAASKKKADDL